jgi:phage terminase large subunit GpA-like protein
MTIDMRTEAWPVGWHEAEQRGIEPRERLGIVEWSEKYRVLTGKTGSVSGRWSWDVAPYMIEPAMALEDWHVRQVTIQGPTQFGKTELSLNFLGHAICEDPAPYMIVMPSEDACKERIRNRVRPMIESCEEEGTGRNPLLEALGGNIENLNSDGSTNFRSMLLFPAWAKSSTTLSDRAVGKLVLDEVKEFETSVGRQSDPVSLAKRRLRTYLFHTLLVTSSPTDSSSLLHREMVAGDRRQAWVPCCHCGGYQRPDWSHVGLDKRDDGRTLLAAGVYAAGGHARWVCPHCGACWSESDRMAAVTKVLWCPDGVTPVSETVYEDLPAARVNALWTHRAEARAAIDAAGIRLEGDETASHLAEHCSYRVGGLLLHTQFLTVDRMAAEFAAAQEHKRAGDIQPLRDWVNNQLGEEFNEAEASTDETILARRRDEYVRGVVPTGQRCILTAGVDVQADHLYAAVWAWGYMYETWLVDWAVIETGDTRLVEHWSMLSDYLSRTWPICGSEGGERVSLALIDHQFNSEAVEQYIRHCPAHVRVEACMGEDWLRERIVRGRMGTRRDPGRHKRGAWSGDTPLWRLSTGDFKSRWARMIEGVDRDGPGRVHLPVDTTEELMHQMSSEYLRTTRSRGQTKKQWVRREGHPRNHWWDCSVYALAAAELRRVGDLPDPSAVTSPMRRVGRMERFRKR